MATTSLYSLATDFSISSKNYTHIPTLTFSATTGETYFVQWNGSMSMSGSTSGNTGGMKFKIDAPAEHTSTCNS